MLTPLEITDAESRLVNGRISLLDVDKLVSTFRRVMGILEVVNNYHFEDKLTALDDTNNPRKPCAQIVACLIRMEELGFPVGELTGSSFGIKGSEKDEFLNYALYAFSKIYPIPSEFNQYGVIVTSPKSRRSSSSVRTTRVF